MDVFFHNSSELDREVLKPLAHIKANWELIWDQRRASYREEEDSFAADLNTLIGELYRATPPTAYHDNEDRLAENVRQKLGWPIRKRGKRWIGADYGSILEQGGFHDLDEVDLVLAAAGRIAAAQTRGQLTYDSMEPSHRRMLGAVIAVILYHRATFEN